LIFIATPFNSRAGESDSEFGGKEIDYDHDEFQEAMTNYRLIWGDTVMFTSDGEIYQDFVRLQRLDIVGLDAGDIVDISRYRPLPSSRHLGTSFYSSILAIEREKFLVVAPLLLTPSPPLVVLGITLCDLVATRSTLIEENDLEHIFLALGALCGTLAIVGGVALTVVGMVTLNKAHRIHTAILEEGSSSRAAVRVSVAPGSLTLRF